MYWRVLVLVMVMALTVGAPQGWAQGTGTLPSVVPSPLDLDPNPVLTKVQDDLHEAAAELLRSRGGVLVPSRVEARLALKEAGKQDYRGSNQALAVLARKAHATHALHVWVQYDARRRLTLIGRVVSDDGKVVRNAEAQHAKGDDKLIDVFRILYVALLTQLKLDELGKVEVVEVADAGVPAPQPVDAGVPAGPPDAGVPLPPPPPPPLVDLGEGQRTAGKVLVGAGAGVAVAGAIIGTIGAIQVGTLRPQNGHLPPSQVQTYETALALRPTGLAVASVGAAAALVGVIVWVAAPMPPVRIVIAPQPGGASIGIAGDLP